MYDEIVNRANENIAVNEGKTINFVDIDYTSIISNYDAASTDYELNPILNLSIPNMNTRILWWNVLVGHDVYFNANECASISEAMGWAGGAFGVVGAILAGTGLPGIICGAIPQPFFYTPFLLRLVHMAAVYTFVLRL